MKNITKIFVFALVLMSFCFRASAQDRPNNPWMERVKSEKIAFLTSEMDLSPEEAQVFWPVYNKADKERFNAMEASFKAFRDMDEAIKANKSTKEISDLLKVYLKAQAASDSIDAKYAEEYLKILPAEKVAKLLVGEEKFRQNQINRLRAPRMGETPTIPGRTQQQKSK